MSDAFWLANRKRVRRATVEFVVQLQPYAMATVGYKKLGHVARNKAEANDLMKAAIRKIALACDERYQGTNRVTTDVLPSDRFEAFCFTEKHLSYPHVHLALFGQSAQDERLQRSLFLLEHFPTSDAKLSERDLNLLKAAGLGAVRSNAGHVVKSCSPHASSHVETITDAQGIGVYLTKEMATRDPSICESYFFLSEFYQRKALPKL